MHRDKFFKSNAIWSNGNKSSDTHSSLEMAKGVCSRLMSEHGSGGRPCKIRGSCIKTFIEVSHDEINWRKYES